MIKWVKYVTKNDDHAFCGEVMIGWIYDQDKALGVYRYRLEFRPNDRSLHHDREGPGFSTRKEAKAAVEYAWSEYLNELGLTYKVS